MHTKKAETINFVSAFFNKVAFLRSGIFKHPMGIGEIFQNGQTEPRLAVGYPKAYIGTSRGEVCS